MNTKPRRAEVIFLGLGGPLPPTNETAGALCWGQGKVRLSRETEATAAIPSTFNRNSMDA